jgi:hypothetical protein
MLDRKQIIIATLFGLLCIGIGYLLYRIFFASESATTTKTTKAPTEATKFPEANQGGPRPGQTPGEGGLPISQSDESVTGKNINTNIVPGELVNVTITGVSSDTKNGNARFYNDQDGKFYRLDADGTLRPMGDEVFYNVQDVTWSPTSDESIIEYPDGANVYYNFETKKQATLPKHWESFSFAPAGDKIAAKSIGFSPDTRWLVAADPEGTSVELVEPLGNNADQVIETLTLHYNRARQAAITKELIEITSGDEAL